MLNILGTVINRIIEKNTEKLPSDEEELDTLEHLIPNEILKLVKSEVERGVIETINAEAPKELIKLKQSLGNSKVDLNIIK